MRPLALFMALFACLVLAAGSAKAERRVALVIGNGAYQNVPQLPNPPRDAGLIGDALKQAGFELTLANDLDHDGLVKALRGFGKAADGADWAVVYYAGHGLEMAGTNYLIPVDARLETDRDVGFEAVSLDQVRSAIEGARSLRMIILDACRNNPFVPAMQRSAGVGRDIGRGLARVEPDQGTLIAYAAKEGTIASDGNGANSPFASALATHMVEPGVEVDRLFRLVRDDVLDATGRKQEPFVYGSLSGRQSFYFVAPAETGVDVPPVVPPVAPNPPARSTEADYQAAERVGTLAAWDAFLRKHGGDADDFYVELAREARQKLVALPPEPPPAPPEPQPEPEPQPSAQVAYSYVGPVSPPDPWLALRTQPSSSQGQQIMQMPQGTLFQVERRQGAWAYVRLRDGTEGWAHTGWIRCCKYLPPAIGPSTLSYSYVGPVSDGFLALRTAPSVSSGQRIMKMPPGTLFEVVRRQGDWAYVRLRDGSQGWANTAWIQCCRVLAE